MSTRAARSVDLAPSWFGFGIAIGVCVGVAHVASRALIVRDRWADYGLSPGWRDYLDGLA